jgi:hypothetical protein
LFLREVDNTIDWQPVEALLMENYEPGKAKARGKSLPTIVRHHGSQGENLICCQPFTWNNTKGSIIFSISEYRLLGTMAVYETIQRLLQRL